MAGGTQKIVADFAASSFTSENPCGTLGTVKAVWSARLWVVAIPDPLVSRTHMVLPAPASGVHPMVWVKVGAFEAGSLGVVWKSL